METQGIGRHDLIGPEEGRARFRESVRRYLTVQEELLDSVESLVSASSTPEAKTMALSVDEVCRQLALGRTKVKELIRSGELPSRRVGRRILVTRAAIDAFLSRESGGK